MRTLIRLVFRVLCVLPLALVADGASAQGTSYLYGGRPIALEYSDAFLSVRYRVPPSARAAGPATMASSQGPQALVEAEVVPSITLLSVHPVVAPDAAGGAVTVDRRQAAREVRQHLLADSAVEWAYPALVHPPSGQLLLLTNEIIVKVRSGTARPAVAALLTGALRVARPLFGADDELILELVSPKTDDPLALANALAGAWWVEWAHPNFLREYTLAAVPDDPMFPDQWPLRNTGQGGGIAGADAELVDAWDVTIGSPDIVIAVIDDGVLQSHPDLSANLWTNPGEIAGNGVDDDGNGKIDDVHGWDFVGNSPDTNPIGGVDSHGTSIAGIAAARGNDGVGVTGACQRCRILPVTIFHGSSFAADAVAAEALRYAARHADVLTNSWGGETPSSPISSAIEFAVTAGRGGKGAPVLFATANTASGYLPNRFDGATSFNIPAGTWTFEWEYLKNGSRSQGFDTAWLDNVAFPDGVVETFEACAGLPPGWSTTGDAPWQIVDDATRASSARGGRCAVKAGTITDDQTTKLQVERTVPAGTLSFNVWVSAETVNGTDSYTARCSDGFRFSLYTTSGALVSRSATICGNQSNQFRPLREGVIAFPASDPRSIAVGASTNFDTRADYSQWGNGLWVVAPSSGGSLGVTTTSGPLTDYTSGFGGTSASAPLAAGIVGLLLSQDPSLTEGQVRDRLRLGTRKIGELPYDGDGWNSRYGYGVLSARLVLGGTTALDYALSSTDPIKVVPGSSGSGTIAVTLVAGSTPSISFSVSGLPSGATASFDPAFCVGPCSATLAIRTAASTRPGTYPITVTGHPLGRQTTFRLVIVAPPRR
jgi:subtilisin family serine protease